MQKDFHYGIIKILSLKAGFSAEQSELIAYASQYVDDATISKPIRINRPVEIQTPRNLGNKFDPVCSAHKGLQFLEDFKRTVQEQIYLSFHFLPSQAYSSQSDYDYVVRPNSKLAQVLIFWALGKLKTEFNTENLIRLGIALHTFADTWSHQNFTGTHCHTHNDIEHIEIWTGEHWKPIKPYKQLINNIFPDIGHAEAYDFPDLPFLRWRYIKAKTKEIVLRDNPVIFLDAAQNIYNILCNFTNHNCNWDELLPWLGKWLEYPEKSSVQRLKFLNTLFPEVDLSYDEHKWIRQALEIGKISKVIRKKAIVKGDMKWFLFHKVAYEQRLFVLSKIKRLTRVK